MHQPKALFWCGAHFGIADTVKLGIRLLKGLGALDSQ